MKTSAYLQRINFRGSERPSLASLRAMLRCHVLNVPFENLDVQFAIPLTNDVEDAFDKIVGHGRGGWCYEQNGLFGWALSELGFDVTRVAAAVRRDERGASAAANHLCLLVQIPDNPDSIYLADVGFGGSMIEPIPLETSSHTQTPFRIGLQQLEDGHWQFSEEFGADRNNYDFLPVPADESAMTLKCGELQSDPKSSFVLNLVAQRRMPDAHVALRGRVLTTNSIDGTVTRTLRSPDELVDTLENVMQLDIPDVGDLWDKIVERHEVLFGRSHS